MAITQEFDLNLIPSSAPVVVHVDQYDHGTGRLVASLYDGDTPYVPTNPSVYIQGTKPDGKYFISSTGVSIEGNVITADLIKTMTQVAGRTRTQFVVTEPTGRTGTFVFWLDVQETAMPDDSEISDTDISMIENAVETVQEAVIEAAEFAQASSDNKEDSEAWAKGTRNGEDVPSTDETYHNNAKYYAEQAAQSASHGGHTIKNENGTAMTARTNLQFANADVEDDAENDCTVVTPRGGTGGSKIVVTTSESSLHNKNVTISDGITTVTEQFSTEGVATFTGITMTGTLTITSTDGTETATDTINVPYYGSYTKAILFVTFNATINISTASTQMQGQTVKVYKNGTQIDTTTFSAGGSATYTAHETGTYKFGCVVDGYEFKSADVVVSAETTYNTTIAYFGATLSIITSSSSLYGKTITIKKGSTTVGTTAFSAQGSASYTVHETGTYTLTCEGHDASVTVSAEQTYNVTINSTPDGETVTPVNDVEIWLACANLSSTGYTTMSQILADSSTLAALIADANAVKYMVRSTGFATDICGNSGAMSLIGLNNNCANSLLANSTWATAICNSTYFESVLNVKVPTMTANNAPYGECVGTAGQSGSYDLCKAFDGDTTTIWNTAAGLTTATIGYHFLNPVNVRKIQYMAFNASSSSQYGNSHNLTLEYSNDGTNYTAISGATYNVAANQCKTELEFTSDNNIYAPYWIIRFSDSNYVNGGNRYILTASLQFYGRDSV